jgi:hypothetical protein
MQRNALMLVFCMCWTACEADDPCDKDQLDAQGRCTARALDASTDSGPVAAASYMDDAGSCSEDPAEALRRACSQASDCNCAAPYCAIMPRQAKGVCTRMCHAMPDDCPEGFRCFDLSRVGVTGVDPFCIEG